ncbi:hypothetical protein [Oryza sativa Japonica Group]|uniref:Uncharacterized protein n=1 Tax=Oryza sativa subsp. japonica TaxID=39947 RepID=Q8LJ82_ORYSJ|nr:hypothetical protein [Oryza sativa Japonica Group]
MERGRREKEREPAGATAVAGEVERARRRDGGSGRKGEEAAGAVERAREAADDAEQDNVLLVTTFLIVVAVGGCRAERFLREGSAAGEPIRARLACASPPSLQLGVLGTTTRKGGERNQLPTTAEAGERGAGLLTLADQALAPSHSPASVPPAARAAPFAALARRRSAAVQSRRRARPD